jgi:hypothetical protein
VSSLPDLASPRLTSPHLALARYQQICLISPDLA